MSTPKTHLIVTSARSLPASIVASCVTTYGLDQDAAVVMTNCVLANDGVFAGALGAPNSVDILVSLADDPFVWHSAEVLKALATSLKPGARFVAAVLANSGNLAAAKQESFLSQTLSTCLVVGFANPHSTGTTTATGVIASLIATKPNWSKGAAFSLKSRKQKENVDSNTQNTQNNKWKVNHLSEDDLMDDDDILDESDFRFGAETAVAAKAAAGGGCDAKKSACKDCSCGRAEAEAGGVELSDDKKKVRIVVTKSQHCFKPSWSALLVTFTAICYNYITSQVHCLPIQYTCRLKTDDTFFYLSQGVDLMDDDDILDESDFRFGAETAVAAKAAAGGGCDAKKSACKDCSCGRAEAEAGGVELSDDKKKVRIVVTKSQHCFKPSWSALLVTFTAICYNYITSQVHCLPIQYTCRLKTDDTFFYLSQGVQIRVRELFPGRRVSVRGVPFAW